LIDIDLVISKASLASQAAVKETFHELLQGGGLRGFANTLGDNIW
jgi:hypothetical protein